MSPKPKGVDLSVAAPLIIMYPSSSNPVYTWIESNINKATTSVQIKPYHASINQESKDMFYSCAVLQRRVYQANHPPTQPASCRFLFILSSPLQLFQDMGILCLLSSPKTQNKQIGILIRQHICVSSIPPWVLVPYWYHSIESPMLLVSLYHRHVNASSSLRYTHSQQRRICIA